MKKFLKGIGINVILLGIVSFITDISSEMMMAILPMFIVSLGGTGVAVGLIGGVGDTISSILKVLSGYWSDKIGKRKPFVFWGYLISSSAKLFFPFCQRWINLLILIPVERVGKGLRTAPRDAIIASSSQAGTKGKAFGIHRAADSSGAVIGAFLAYVFYISFELDFKPILLISALVSFFAIIPIFWIKEKPLGINIYKEEADRLNFKASLKSLPFNFKKYLFAAMVFSLSSFTYMFFILKAKESFSQFYSLRSAIAVPILLYVWFNVVYAFFSIPSGTLSDKIGRKKVLITGYISYALTCFGFAFMSASVSIFIVLFGLYGISFALIDPNQRALASDFVGEELCGTALGTFHTSISLVNLPAGIIAGLLWNYNSSAPFVYGGVVAVLGTIFLLWSHPVRSN